MKSLKSLINESFVINEAFRSKIINDLFSANLKNKEILKLTFNQNLNAPLSEIRDSDNSLPANAEDAIKSLDSINNSKEVKFIVLTNPKTNEIIAIVRGQQKDGKKLIKLIYSTKKSKKSDEERLRGAMANKKAVKGYALTADAKYVEAFDEKKKIQRASYMYDDPLKVAKRRRDYKINSKKTVHSERNAELQAGSHPDMSTSGWYFPPFRATYQKHKLFMNLSKDREGDIELSIEVGEPGTGFYAGAFNFVLDYKMKMQEMTQSPEESNIDGFGLNEFLNKIIARKGYWFGTDTAADPEELASVNVDNSGELARINKLKNNTKTEMDPADFGALMGMASKEEAQSYLDSKGYAPSFIETTLSKMKF